MVGDDSSPLETRSIDTAREEMGRAMDALMPSAALTAIFALVRRCNAYIDQSAPWNASTLARTSPIGPPRAFAIVIGPVGFADTNSTWMRCPFNVSPRPKRSPSPTTTSTCLASHAGARRTLTNPGGAPSTDAISSRIGTPITASETLTSRYSFRELLERRAVGIVMLDPGWVGGLSEARRIATLAEAYHRPVAPHDCTGPVVYTAGTHFCLATPNAMIQEGVRAYYQGWYREVLTELPRVEMGQVAAPSGPGLGTRLQDGFTSRPGVSVRASTS